MTSCDPRTVVERDLREDDSSVMPTTSSPVVSSSSTTGTAGMCYMINGRRMTKRLMTKAEKREMKHKLKLEAHLVRREARARDVEERIRKERLPRRSDDNSEGLMRNDDNEYNNVIKLQSSKVVIFFYRRRRLN